MSEPRLGAHTEFVDVNRETGSGDAHAEQPQRFANRTQQDLRHRGKAVHRAAACPQKEPYFHLMPMRGAPRPTIGPLLERVIVSQLRAENERTPSKANLSARKGRSPQTRR